MPRLLTLTWVTVWTLATSLAASTALAQGERRVVVEAFTGPGAAGVRTQFLRSAAGVTGLTFVAEDDAQQAARQAGVELRSEPGYAAVGSTLRVHAFVGGTVTVERNRARLTLRVREGATGTLLAETAMTGRRLRNLQRAVGRQGWRRVEAAVRRAQAGEPGTDGRAMYREAPPTVDLSQTDVHEARRDALDPELYGERSQANADAAEVREASRTRFRPQHSALDAFLGLMFLNRGFDYRDANPDSAKTTPYSLPFGPALALEAEWFPAAHFTNNLLAQLGISLGVERSFFLTTAGPEDVSFDTTHSAWSAGVLLRIPMARNRITIGAAFGNHGFSIEPQHPRDPAPDIATVSYQHARFGAGARVALGDLRLIFDAAYLLVLDAGPIDQPPFFPGTSTVGVRGAVGASYPLGGGFELRGRIDLRLFLLDFEPNADGSADASGAIDRNLSATLGVAWTMEPARRYLDDL